MNRWVFLCSIAFLLGSIPFGVFFSHLFGSEDVRKKGSGNIGATNVSRVVGFWPAGFLTFLCDALKGTLAAALAGPWFGYFATISFGLLRDSPGENHDHLLWAASLFVVAGHCFSPWLRFRGGKGVATGFGAFLILSPVASVVGLAGFTITFFSTRLGSLSSLVGLFMVVLAHWVLPGFYLGPHLIWGLILIFMILARHEKNIDALLESRENRFI